MNMGQPNIIWIILDTVRAKNLSLHGYERETTPFLESFAENSLFYPRAYSPAPWTTPSHGGMFTGTYRVAHQTDRGNERLTPDLPSIASLLSDAGYTTVGFSNNAHVSPDFDFDRGFDRFIFNTEAYNEPLSNGVPITQVRSHVGDGPFHEQVRDAFGYITDRDESTVKTIGNWLYCKAAETGLRDRNDRGAESANEFVREFVSDIRDQPFFMYLNYMEGHAPYQAPFEYQYKYCDSSPISNWGTQKDYFAQKVPNQEQKVRALEDQYDGCISYLDAKIAELIQILRDQKLFKDSLVVITSDHGEAFGEWGLYEHKAGLYDELTRVPLILNPPTADSGEISQPVSTRSLFLTSLLRAEADVPDHAVGVNLLDPIPDPVVLESEGLPYEDWGSEEEPLRKFTGPHEALIRDQKKYISYDVIGDSELFGIDAESPESSQSDPETCDEMSSDLDQLLNEQAKPDRTDADGTDGITAETQEQLRTLGYR